MSSDQVVFWLGALNITYPTAALAGTMATCDTGSNMPFYSSYIIGSATVIAVNPGDLIKAIVVEGGEVCPRSPGWYVSSNVKDVSTGSVVSYKVTGCGVLPVLSSECIVASANEGGVDIPLANFSVTKFFCNATTLGGTNIKLVMYNDAGSGVMAQPSVLSGDKSNFRVQWLSFGP